MSKKLFFGFILLLFAAAIVPAQFSQPQMPWWFLLEQGKQHFRNGLYGEAFSSFEEARRARHSHFTRLEEDFIMFLSIPDVRWLGDSLEFVEWYIDTNNQFQAAEILNELYHYYPRTALGGSVNRALEELDHLKSYPEAEYWLGETFRVEGELSLAYRQYERALNQQALFQNPEFDLEILYRITDLQRTRGDFVEMEKRTLEIIHGNDSAGNPRDRLWSSGISTDIPNPIRAAMLRILEGDDGINRFLTIYRHNNMITEKAHRELGLHYYSHGRYITAAEHLMFAFLIQNTVLIEEIIRREFDYVYTSLENLMLMIGTRRELLSFMDETEYFKNIYYFSSALYANGRTRSAVYLWDFLAQSSRSGEWGDRARRAGTPFIEAVVVMP